MRVKNDRAKSRDGENSTSGMNHGADASRTLKPGVQEPEFLPDDPTDYDPVRFDGFTITAVELKIPSGIHVVKDGVVQWRDTESEMRKPISDSVLRKGQKVTPGILTDFVALEDGNDEDVCTFIGRWGFLGIDAERVDNTPKAVVRPLEAGSYTFADFREKTETYRHWARRVQAVLNIARAVQQGQTAAMEDREIWLGRQQEELERAEYQRLLRQSIPEIDAEGREIIWRMGPALRDQEEQIEMAVSFADSVWHWSKNEATSTDCAAELTDIMAGWLRTETQYSFQEENSPGQARPFSRMRLATTTQKRFHDWFFTSRSVLLPLGQALLHSLKSPAVSCKICGKVVPGAAKRNDRGQFCGVRCRQKDDRAKSAIQYQKRKAAKQKG